MDVVIVLSFSRQRYLTLSAHIQNKIPVRTLEHDSSNCISDCSIQYISNFLI